MPDAVVHTPPPAAAGPPRRLPRLLASAAVVATMLTGLAVAYTGSAQAAVGSPLINAATGQCLDVTGQQSAPGTPVGVYQCNGQANQNWDFAGNQLRVYEGTPMCLDIPQDSAAPGIAMHIWGCHTGANQRWELTANGTIVSARSGMCLAAVGAVVQTAVCTGAAAQRWTRTAGDDTEPPSAPSGLRTTGLTCERVNLFWSAATDNVGVAFYDIYHDGQLMTSVSGSTLSTALTLVPGANWGIYVNARDAAGNVSQASSTLTIEVPQCGDDPVPPTAPTNLAATAAGTSVTLTWSAATDNIGVTGYDIFRGATIVGSVTGTALSFTDSGLTANTSYTYQVQARDARNNRSPMSGAVTVRTAAACNNPVCSVREVATDTDIPWGLVTLPDGSVLYARRDAHDIVRLVPSTGAKSTVGTVPNTSSTDGEGGLMGLAISPSFLTDRWLYIMHTSPSDNRIVRMRVNPANRL
ncbi:MAG TPA: ricin-type beta-trefoil lectin domain protein, partial [Catenuloplanes sp.]